MLEIQYNTTAERGAGNTPKPPNHSSRQGAIMADIQVSRSRAESQSKKSEVWKPVPSAPGVLASSLGRILLPPRHAPMSNGGYRIYTTEPSYGFEAKSNPSASHVYMMINYRPWGGSPKSKKVHRLVCEAFHGEPPFDGAVVIHIDEDATNNNPSNLRWGTQKENLNAPGFIEYCKGRVGDLHPRKRKPRNQ